MSSIMPAGRRGTLLSKEHLIIYLLFTFHHKAEFIKGKGIGHSIEESSLSRNSNNSNAGQCPSGEFYHPVTKSCVKCQPFWDNTGTFSSDDKQFFKGMCGCHPILQFSHPITKECIQCSEMCLTNDVFCQNNCKEYLKFKSNSQLQTEKPKDPSTNSIASDWQTNLYSPTSSSSPYSSSHRPTRSTEHVIVFSVGLLGTSLALAVAYIARILFRRIKRSRKAATVSEDSSIQDLENSVQNSDNSSLLHLPPSEDSNRVRAISSLQPSDNLFLDHLTSLNSGVAEETEWKTEVKHSSDDSTIRFSLLGAY